MVPSDADPAPVREKARRLGEKRMACLKRPSKTGGKPTLRWHLSNERVNRKKHNWLDLKLKSPHGWWIITLTLSWTVIQLAASFWRISVTPLESLSYFSLGSSSLSSSWWRQEMGSHWNTFSEGSHYNRVTSKTSESFAENGPGSEMEHTKYPHLVSCVQNKAKINLKRLQETVLEDTQLKIKQE